METIDKSRLISIQSFAELCKTTPRTLRFYEEKGLFSPTYIDSFTKYRYYDPNLAREFFKLKLLQEAQMPIAEIQALQTEEISSAFLDKKLQNMQQDISEKQKQLVFFQQMKDVLYSNKDADLLLQEESIGPFVLLCLKNEHGSYARLFEDTQKIITVAKAHNLALTNEEMTFYLDPFVYNPKETKLEVASILRLDTIPKDILLPEGFYFKYLPKITVRTFTYRGPFTYLALVYQKFHEKSKNRQLLANELYFDYILHGPWDSASEYEYVTKLCFPQI